LPVFEKFAGGYVAGVIEVRMVFADLLLYRFPYVIARYQVVQVMFGACHIADAFGLIVHLDLFYNFEMLFYV
jgi:hypothetical protein